MFCFLLDIGAISPNKSPKNSVVSSVVTTLPTVSLITTSTSSSCTQLAESSSSEHDEFQIELPNSKYQSVNGNGNSKPLLVNDALILACPKAMGNSIGSTLPVTNSNGIRSHNECVLSSGQTETMSNKLLNNSGMNMKSITKGANLTGRLPGESKQRLSADQTKAPFPLTQARKISHPTADRRHSISSEESLSDYDELGTNHSTINGFIGSQRRNR